MSIWSIFNTSLLLKQLIKLQSKMNIHEETIEILMIIDFQETIVYPNDDVDEFVENKRFRAIINELNIGFNIKKWVNSCYEILGGKRDNQEILVHYSNDLRSYILLNNYFDPISQIDYVSIGFMTTKEKETKLVALCREFYDNCNFKVTYCEGENIVFQKYPIDKKKLARMLNIEKPKHMVGKKIKIR